MPLPYVAHAILLNSCVLGTGVGELGEGCEKGFDSGPWHLSKLSRKYSLPAPVVRQDW